MKAPGRIWYVLLGAAGYVSFFAVYRTAYPESPAGPIRFDLKEGRRLAGNAAVAALGIDVSSWAWMPNKDYNHTLSEWQKRYARQGLDLMRSPFQAVYVFEEPVLKREITISLSTSGRPASVRVKLPRRNQSFPVLTDPQSAEMAQRIFRLLAGSLQTEFGQPQTFPGKNDLEYRWTARSPGSSGSSWMDWDIRVRFENERFHEANLAWRMEESARKKLERSGTTLGVTGQVLLGVAAFLGIPLIALLYVFQWIRGSADHSSALTAGAITLATSAVMLASILAEVGATASGKIWIGLLLMTVFQAPAFASLFGLGLTAARAREWKQWIEVRLLLQRKWKAKAIGRALAEGFLASGIIAAIPYLLVWSGLFPGASLSQEIHFLVAMEMAQPAAVLHPPFEIYSTVCFAFLLPVLSRRLRRSWLVTPVFVALAGAAFLMRTEFSAGLAAAVVNSGLTVCALYWIYSRHGLLAVLAAAQGSDAILAANMAIHSASAELHSSGFVTLGLFGAFWLGCIVWAVKGKDLSPDEGGEIQYLSAREKLKAEFLLARQAQERMLPSEAPGTPGFFVAAACQPAREVGGDLYDYFRLPDGRLGICVADVSGKGMSAALFMTLTKGILTAASEESSDVGALARHLNRHLYAACRRRAFVTAVIAGLDAHSRTFEYIRAGHNPALWFEAARGSARFLNSRGMGFALAGPALFDRSTDPDRIVLSGGDIVVLYSDGVTEALNEKKQLYGEERLQRVVEGNANGSAQAVLEAIREDLKRFTGTEPPHDDVTLVVLQAANST